ncbi:type IV secretion system protein VirB6 [Novosphingobium sp. PhB165]|uniref:type IV secretion system protein n=1 Tax=Novosphingobium sp. PhB165 TaxID=2485105 RepID=UPI00104446C7|nr:type IV secretion system protein [Novosphingobium sp. PhB165]TCM18045.1 type IV secretion system protein VirB6 [Novosphingobium sp. PhB165]
MSAACEQLTELASQGVAPALRAVDCVSNEMAAAAFGRLFGANGAMAPVLILVLTLYIAFLGFSLLSGRSSLSVSALTPRMLTIGFVLTFATSWIAYQSVVWNLAIGGPDWIAGVLMDAKGSATQIFGDRIDIVFNAIAEASQAATQSGGEAAQGAAQGAAAAGAGAAKTAAAAGGAGLFSPDSVMWMGALLLLLGTVGVLLTARIALGVLVALGPIFVVLGLFGGTRGLTAGWLRGVALTAMTPLFVVLGGGITLELLVPIVSSLVKGAEMGEIDGRAAMALFVVAAVHLALMGMVLKVAGTLVSGWRVFGLADNEQARGRSDSAAQSASAPMPSVQVQPFAPASAQGRAPAISAASAAAMVTASGGEGGSATHASDRRTVITQVSGGGIEPLAQGAAARARGIGSRFRNASNDTSRDIGRKAAGNTGPGPAKEKS